MNSWPLEKIANIAEKAEAEARAKMAEAKKLRSRAVQHRRIVRDGESLKNQEHMARIRLAEKLQKLAVMPVEQVKRNVERFPPDFMFQLTKDECLRSQIATLNMERGRHLKYYPYVFTEGGIAMLSGVLRSATAIEANIRIMRAFVAMRHVLMSSVGVLQRLGTVEAKQIETDKRLDTVFDALDRSKLLPCGILPANSEYDSIRMVSRLIAQAKSELLIIDPYADVTLLDILSEKAPGVTVRLVCKDRGKPTRSEIEKFNRQYKGLTVEHSDDFHDQLVGGMEKGEDGFDASALGCSTAALDGCINKLI